MKLSVIIPIYNVEKYVRKCILSVVEQDLDISDYEIIAVNDSSPDNSRSIVTELAGKYKNIRILDVIPNQGVSAARNMGLENALGEYLLFFDGDDFLEPNVLGGLVRIMDAERLDTLCSMCRGVNEQGEQIQWSAVQNIRITDLNTISGGQYVHSNQYMVMVGLYMFRREFLIRNGLRFEKLIKHEDEIFTPKALALSERIRYNPQIVYNYVKRENSLSNDYAPQNIYLIIEAMTFLDRFIHSGQTTDPKALSHIEERIKIMLRYAIRLNIKNKFCSDNDLIMSMKANSLLPRSNRKFKLSWFLLNNFPGLYISTHKSSRKK